jgi:RNA polymerase subunit RPABC4/transcription elongation factor Spt4
MVAPVSQFCRFDENLAYLTIPILLLRASQTPPVVAMAGQVSLHCNHAIICPSENAKMLDPSAVSNPVIIATIFAAIFLFAFWLSLIVWTYRDIRGRSRNSVVRFLSVLAATLLFIPGILVYLVLRPSRTLEEEYQRSLEEEALLQSIEDQPVCPGCGRHIKEDWILCPNCHTRLKKNCHECNRLMELTWNLCPYCGTPAPGVRVENLTMDDALRTLPGEPTE